ncbi:PREDICTED: interleukin-1 receptor-associated kinase-like 2 [Gavialis gangeticus]|uniref:interleukin-1 receptor-associated kinase-like 2 n=1 Tax=Gavialis gangeticus TaxID=94835 RepID=UPI00092EF1DE|nr:PREDICTED: interleukin-1 receptor-associated kinase-like 2 [Gavialis gangeticus]
MANGENGATRALASDSKEMDLQPLSLSSTGSSLQSLRIYSLPAWVLEDFCQKMDCLSDYDWMRFASYVITDQTELRKIKCMEKTGISITRELMWWWGVRLATVQQLLELLQGLELYRAAQVILDWSSSSNVTDPVKAPLEPPKQESISLSPTENKSKAKENGTGSCSLPDLTYLPKPSASPVFRESACSLPCPPPPPDDLMNSLQSNIPSSVKPCGSTTQLETNVDLPSESLLWTSGEVINATQGFREENRINEGIFADVYKGWRDNAVYVIKRLKEMECTSPNSTQRFFHTEVQISFRCCHINILQLLGFSAESGFHCLIYPYLPNESLENRLQCQSGSMPLTWEKRISIAIGVIRAIQYLHNFGILHGNVKSSNVLLDENFTAKLGHSGLRMYPVDKKSEYAVMKTKVLQTCLAYVPEDFIRHGQLTEKIDIFGCGIILAEILTGLQTTDEGRHPIYLKDIIAEEIQLAKEQLHSKDRAFENLAAKEICSKYQDGKAGHVPEEIAVPFATALCLCLRKKNPSITEVLGIMEMIEHKSRDHSLLEDSAFSGFSINTPEETDDETAFLSLNGSSDNSEDNARPRSLNCANSSPPLIRIRPPEVYNGHTTKVPCESDESSSFVWNPMEGSTCGPLATGCTHPENAMPSESRKNDEVCAESFQKRNALCHESQNHLEMATPANRNTNPDPSCSSQALTKETSWEIRINDQKKKLMENILLYEEDKLNSSELFES